MNFKKYKWIFYILTFFLITIVATILSAMKPGDKVPDVPNAILLVGTVYLALFLLYRLFKSFRNKREDEKIVKMASEIFDDNQNTSKTKQSFIGVFKRRLNIKSLPIIAGIFLVLVLFYWFQYRPSEIRRSCAEEAIKDINTATKVRENNRYRECLVKHGLRPESLFVETQAESVKETPDTSNVEGAIDDLKSSLQNSLDEQKQQMQDEFNNQANCQSNGGRYQGNGMCVYY